MLPTARSLLLWISVLFILIVGVGLRGRNLSSVPKLIWDERYYVPAAREMMGTHNPEPLRRALPHPFLVKSPDPNYEHPPLGKLLIGLGILTWGDTPRGWRYPSFIFSVLTLLVIGTIAYQLMGTPGTLWTMFLASIDFLPIVHGRLGVLDPFLCFFGAIPILSAVMARGQPKNRLGWLALGAAGALLSISVKHLGALSLAALVTLAYRQDRSRHQIRTLVAMSGAVMATYCLWYFYYAGAGYSLSEWVRHQFSAHQTLLSAGNQSAHSYPWQWLVNQKPIWYFFSKQPFQGIVAMGHPLIWWLFVPSLATVAYHYRKHRAFADEVILVWFGWTFLPLLIVAIFRRDNMYLYQMMPSLTPGYLAIARTIGVLRTRPVYQAVYGVLLAGFTLLFVPVLWGTLVTYDYLILLSFMVPF